MSTSVGGGGTSSLTASKPDERSAVGGGSSVGVEHWPQFEPTQQRYLMLGNCVKCISHVSVFEFGVVCVTVVRLCARDIKTRGKS